MKKKFDKKYITRIGALTLVVLALSIFSSNIISVVGKGTDFLSAVVSSVLVDLTNTDRASANLSELKINPKLIEAAQAKADDMASKSYFAHNSPEGRTPWYWFGKAGYDYKYAGENLAVNFVESKDVEQAWMASPTHKWNIMNKNFTEIGIATSTGIYEGKEAIFVVQMFGKPK